MANDYLFTSESVTEGHPDKIADQISDAVLDAILKEDPKGRVACETMITAHQAIVAGEITTSANPNIESIVRKVIQDIGYDDQEKGLDWRKCQVQVLIGQQSSDIAQGVMEGDTQGAGDQGLMFGYACNETPEQMPMPIALAHRLSRRLAQVRKENILDFLRPDGKSQVTVEYQENKPIRVRSVVISAQHDPEVQYAELREGIIEEVIRKEIPKSLWSNELDIYVNPTGRFVVGGPHGDCGLTGRKIVVDTYGGMGRHGGGAFSGKDPSKVDRSATYMMRYVANQIVAAKLAQRCEVQVAYAIGVADPMSVYVNTFGTGTVSDEHLTEAVNKLFNLRPHAIIKSLDLLQPIYRNTAAYGHFGRIDLGLSWEKTDQANELKQLVSKMGQPKVRSIS